MLVKSICVMACGLAMSLATAAHAQNYPARPVRVVVPFSPGGATDIIARLMANQLSSRFGQQVIIENKPGANTAIGAESVAKAPADGYTLLFSNDQTFVLNAVLFSKLSYDPIRDFAPVATAAYLPLTIVVNASLPVSNLKELVAYTQARKGQLSYASYGVGSQAHIMGEMYKKLTGTDLVHVAYKGSAPAVADVVGGQVLFTFPGIPTIHGFLKGGKLKVLALSGDKRNSLLPDVPTFAEAGYKDLDVGAWYGFVAPAGTPRDIVSLLNSTVASIITNPEFVEKSLTGGGMVPLQTTPEQFAAFMRTETERMGAIIRQSGAKAE
jgi:tripartite-type tricarboxylate transporter receptor subunit TctC